GQRFDVSHGQVRVQFAKLAPNRADHGFRFGGGSDQQMVVRKLIADWDPHERLWYLADGPVFSVPRDAGDLPWLSLRRGSEPFPERVFDRVGAGEEIAGECFVDDGRANLPFLILLGKIAPGHERRADGLEILQPDVGLHRLWRVDAPLLRPAFDQNRSAVVVHAERHEISDRGRSHAGQRLDAVEQLFAKLHAGVGLVTLQAQVEVHHQGVFGIEPGIHYAQSL